MTNEDLVQALEPSTYESVEMRLAKLEQDMLFLNSTIDKLVEGICKLTALTEKILEKK